MINYLNNKQYKIMRAKLEIALTSKMYDDDEPKRALIVKFYRQCLYCIMRNKPLPTYPA